LTTDTVAELCGNTAKTVAKCHAHLESKEDTLREMARRAVGEQFCGKSKSQEAVVAIVGVAVEWWRVSTTASSVTGEKSS